MEPELTVRRMPEYQVTDRPALYQVLDEALIAHVGVIRDGSPVVLPFACGRDGDYLLLHGSTGAGVLRLGATTPVCVTVTHLDGLVFARSLFESSMHYRCAVIFGDAEVLVDEDRRRALDTISDHLFPGRTTEVRTHTRKELAATLVLRVALDRASVKIGNSAPDDPDDGESREVWAGVVPISQRAGDPVPAGDVPVSVPVPESVRRAVARG
jgi:uncharacterized protein